MEQNDNILEHYVSMAMFHGNMEFLTVHYALNIFVDPGLRSSVIIKHTTQMSELPLGFKI